MPPKSSRFLTDEIVSLAESGLKQTTNLRNKLKLQIIISAKKYGIKKTAEMYNISVSALRRWIHRLQKESLEGLNNKPKKPRNSSFTQEHKKAIMNWLINDNNMTVRTLRNRIEKELGLKVSNTSAHNIMQKLGFTYVRPRTGYYKKG